MRTEKTDKVFLKLPIQRPQALRNIKPGAELTATIVIRHGAKDAVLDIAGMRIRAQFPGGVPAGAPINLKLEKIEGNSFFFKLIGGREVNHYKGTVLDHAVLPPGHEFPRLRAGIARFVESGAASLYHLSAILLDIEKNDTKKETPAAILRRLAALGLGKESIMDLSILNLLSHFPASETLRLLAAAYGEDAIKWDGNGGEDGEALLNKILREVDSITEKDSPGEVLGAIAQLLGHGGCDKNPSSGTVAFIGEDEIVPVRYLLSRDSIFLELNFTALGTVDILGKKGDKELDIHLYCEKTEAMEALAVMIEDRGDIEAKIGIPVRIGITRMGDIINKIVEINSHNSLNSVIDVTV